MYYLPSTDWSVSLITRSSESAARSIPSLLALVDENVLLEEAGVDAAFRLSFFSYALCSIMCMRRVCSWQSAVVAEVSRGRKGKASSLRACCCWDMQCPAKKNVRFLFFSCTALRNIKDCMLLQVGYEQLNRS